MGLFPIEEIPNTTLVEEGAYAPPPSVPLSPARRAVFLSFRFVLCYTSCVAFRIKDRDRCMFSENVADRAADDNMQCRLVDVCQHCTDRQHV